MSEAFKLITNILAMAERLRPDIASFFREGAGSFLIGTFLVVVLLRSPTGADVVRIFQRQLNVKPSEGALLKLLPLRLRQGFQWGMLACNCSAVILLGPVVFMLAVADIHALSAPDLAVPRFQAFVVTTMALGFFVMLAHVLARQADGIARVIAGLRP